jgi:hypothetical protein
MHPAFRFAQAKVKMVNDQTGGGALFRIQLTSELNAKVWWVECSILSESANGQSRTRLTLASPLGDSHTTGALNLAPTFNQWHTLRLEMDPETFNLKCYLDGWLADAYTPKDASRLKSAFFKLNFGIYAQPNRSATFQIDEFRIGR